MTITVTSLVAGPAIATGNAQTIPFTFKAFSDDEIGVSYYEDLEWHYIDPSDFTVDRNVSITGVAEEGGSVTVAADVFEVGTEIFVEALPTFDQAQVWNDSGSALRNLNEALDRAVLRVLRVQLDLERGLTGAEAILAQALAALADVLEQIANAPNLVGNKLDIDGANVGEEAETLRLNIGVASAADLAGVEAIAQQAVTNALRAAGYAGAMRGVYPGAREAIPQGVIATSAITPGTGGTPGTYDLSFTGGDWYADPSGTFTVNGSGQVSSITFTGRGYEGEGTTAPTLDFSEATGLTGADATIIVGDLIGSGEFYFTDHESDTTLAVLFQNVEGVPTEVTPLFTQPQNLSAFLLGRVGQVLVQLSDDPADVGYVDRADLNAQPFATIDMADTAQRQILVDNGLTNPHLRISATDVGGKLHIKSLLSGNQYGVGAITLKQAAKNRLYRYRFRVENTANPANVGQWGFGAQFLSSAPTPGVPVANAPAGTTHILFRANGDFQAVTFSTGNGGTVDASVPLTNEVVQRGLDVSKDFDMTFLFLDDTGTQVAVEVVQEGETIASVTASGLDANSYFGPGARMANTANDEFSVQEVSYFGSSLDVTKRINLYPGAGAVGGIGTESNPFQTWQEATDSLDVDKDRRTARVVLKGGVWVNAGIQMPSFLKRLELVGARGTRPYLRGSVEIDVDAGWVQIAGTLAWKLPNPASRSLSIGGLIQTDRSSVFGLPGSYNYTAPYSLYARRPDLLPAAMIAGEMRVDYTGGAHDGSIIVVPWDGADPNDCTWRITTRSAVVSARGALGTYNDQVLSMRNLNVEDGYAYGIRADLVEVDIEDVIVRSTMVGVGADFKDTIGSVRNLLVQGTYSDCIHADDSTVGTGIPGRTRFEGTVAEGAFYYVLNGLQHFGDAWSNHFYNEWDLIGCGGHASGKDGISSSGGLRARDFDAKGNRGSGIVIYRQVGSTPGLVDVKGGRLTGNGYAGITLNGANIADATAHVDVDRVYFADNGTTPDSGGTHAEVFGASTAPLSMTLRGCIYDNTDGAPDAGNTKESAGTPSLVERGCVTLT